MGGTGDQSKQIKGLATVQSSDSAREAAFTDMSAHAVNHIEPDIPARYQPTSIDMSDLRSSSRPRRAADHITINLPIPQDDDKLKKMQRENERLQAELTEKDNALVLLKRDLASTKTRVNSQARELKELTRRCEELEQKRQQVGTAATQTD